MIIRVSDTTSKDILQIEIFEFLFWTTTRTPSFYNTRHVSELYYRRREAATYAVSVVNWTMNTRRYLHRSHEIFS